MYITNKCGCGLTNYTFKDWLTHWKYGVVHEYYEYEFASGNRVQKDFPKFLYKHSKLRAIYFFLKTEIYIKDIKIRIRLIKHTVSEFGLAKFPNHIVIQFGHWTLWICRKRCRGHDHFVFNWTKVFK